MKKLIAVVLLALSVLSACAPSKPAVTDPGPVDSKVDIRDKTALYNYFKSEIANISREQFDQWDVLYCDVTGDGAEDAVLVSPNVAWHDKVEIVTSDGGKFGRVTSEIPLLKYTNEAAYDDGLLMMVGGTGGSGEYFALMDLYVYSDAKMTRVLEGLVIEHTVDFPTASFVETAEIDGKLTDFTYILTKHDNMTNKTTIVKKEKYTFNPSTKSFTVTPLSTAQAPKLYLHQLSNGASVGRGLTIKDIDFKKGTDNASFTLSGSLELMGRLLWDDAYNNDLVFIVSEAEDFPVFLIEGSYEVLEYMPKYLAFRNSEALQKALGKNIVDNIKAGSNMETMMKVTNIRVGIKIGSEGGADCEFVSIGKQTAVPASEYEVNKIYKYDIDGDGKDDEFMVETDGKEHYSIMVNGTAITLEVLPDLAFHKFKLTKMSNSSIYAITIFVANPPNEEEIYFYEFKKPLEISFIGKVVAPELGFGASINNLTSTQVTIGSKTYNFKDFVGK